MYLSAIEPYSPAWPTALLPARPALAVAPVSPSWWQCCKAGERREERGWAVKDGLPVWGLKGTGLL